ncbi:RT_RNaseH_2 domain-containing protein [Nephila pilipes]|uniref:RT_RNaseH_2 domain-containing protein n=1 Tax=Nephila pilipes TaxID=299642 RepID=A0A8X6Q2W4_NEPPI|nr:RT_RNaseH_2 domain-containing protein [Nephila pilipes]
MCNSHRQFIPHSARMQAVLNSYLKGAKINDQTLVLCSDDSTAAFQKCKKDLEEATILYHPAADGLLAIVVDASDTAVGSCMLTVPTCKCISVYKKRDRKILDIKLLIRARAHRSCGTPTSIRRFSLLPHLCGSVLQMARSVSTGRDFHRGRDQGLLHRLNLQIQSTPQINYRLRKAVRIISI